MTKITARYCFSSLLSKIMKKIIFVYCFFFFTPISAIYFLNRYFTPELSTSILDYRTFLEGITLQPFVISANQANKTPHGSNLNLYEIDGGLSIKTLNESYEIFTGKTGILPSEWILYNYSVPIRLQGNITNTGIGWTLNYQLVPGCTIGWSSALSQITGAINLHPQEESQKYKLKESMLFETLKIYNTLTEGIGLIQNYTQYTNIADQDFYLKFDVNKDFAWQFRKIKFTAQLGTVVPTAHIRDLYNVADIPGGTDGFYLIYGGLFLDLLLKEDFNFGVMGKLMYQIPQNKKIRTRSWNESARYGSFIGNVDVSPGYLYNFSPYISLEGIRRGLGVKLSYTVWGETETQYGFNKTDKIIDQAKMYTQKMSSWAQEHCEIIIFYDFMREETNYRFEPFLAFSAQIPVDFFFANNSAQTLGFSFICQLLF